MNQCGFFLLGTEASSWTSSWIQQEFDLCVIETFIVRPQLNCMLLFAMENEWLIKS